MDEATEFIAGAIGGGATGGGGPFIVDDADSLLLTNLSPHAFKCLSVGKRVSIDITSTRHVGGCRGVGTSSAEASRLLFHA